MVAAWLVSVMVCTVALPSFLAAAPTTVEGERGKVLPWKVRGEDFPVSDELEPEGKIGLGGLVEGEDGMMPEAK